MDPVGMESGAPWVDQKTMAGDRRDVRSSKKQRGKICGKFVLIIRINFFRGNILQTMSGTGGGRGGVATDPSQTDVVGNRQVKPHSGSFQSGCIRGIRRLEGWGKQW